MKVLLLDVTGPELKLILVINVHSELFLASRGLKMNLLDQAERA